MGPVAIRQTVSIFIFGHGNDLNWYSLAQEQSMTLFALGGIVCSALLSDYRFIGIALFRD